jgi:uncharacterized YceG family protein
VDQSQAPVGQPQVPEQDGSHATEQQPSAPAADLPPAPEPAPAAGATENLEPETLDWLAESTELEPQPLDVPPPELEQDTASAKVPPMSPDAALAAERPSAESPPREPDPLVAAEPAEVAPAAQAQVSPGAPIEQPRRPERQSLIPPPLPPLPQAPAGLGVRPSSPARHRRSRSPLARGLAVLALAAVVVAVILLLRSLHHSSSPTATVAAPRVVKVLVVEGKTRAQIAEVAKADGLGGSYKSASVSSPQLNPAQYGAPQHTPDLEGFLFPATYDMNPGEPAKRLVEEQLEAFKENFGAKEIARARALHVTPYQLLTIASMVEREAQVPGDRAKIAAVIYNRLHDGMPLGIDATIYYAVELQEGIATYTKELTAAQLHIDSPYNTRIHTGLPPTPISNPGLASIQAAAHPAHVGYLYYVAGANGCGEQIFSDTQAEFEANVAAYQTAEQKNGGHPPTCKRK